MAELIAETWIFLVIALLAGVVVAWWIFAANRKATIAREAPPEGGEAAGAKRNQALIDAPPASAAPSTGPPPATPEGLAGVGTAVAATAEPAPPAEGDDLTRIKGIGPKLATILRGLGVTSFAQIAAWDEAEVERIDARLGTFAGRIRRDDWRTQARLLAEGDIAAFEARFGKT